MTAVDPLGENGFQTSTVFGNTQTTYHFDGAASPVTDLAGLDVHRAGLIASTKLLRENGFNLAAGTMRGGVFWIPWIANPTTDFTSIPAIIWIRILAPADPGVRSRPIPSSTFS